MRSQLRAAVSVERAMQAKLLAISADDLPYEEDVLKVRCATVL